MLQLIKEADELILEKNLIIEEFDLKNILVEDKTQLSENVKQFLRWATNLIDRPVVNKAQIERDPSVKASEALPFDVKDEQDAYLKLAKTAAGLSYFMNQKVDKAEKEELAKRVYSDASTDEYVKKYGMLKAKALVDKITKELQSKNRSFTTELLKQIEQFYNINVIK